MAKRRSPQDRSKLTFKAQRIIYFTSEQNEALEAEVARLNEHPGAQLQSVSSVIRKLVLDYLALPVEQRDKIIGG
jgi:hypothetical protein